MKPASSQCQKQPTHGPVKTWNSGQTQPATYAVYGGSHVAGPSRNLASKTGATWHSAMTSGARGVTITFENEVRVSKTSKIKKVL